MIIEVTNEDIATKDPIKNAVKRQFNLDVIVDAKYITFAPFRPFRLPLSAELWEFDRFTGKDVKPFVFSIEAQVNGSSISN